MIGLYPTVPLLLIFIPSVLIIVLIVRFIRDKNLSTLQHSRILLVKYIKKYKPKKLSEDLIAISKCLTTLDRLCRRFDISPDKINNVANVSDELTNIMHTYSELNTSGRIRELSMDKAMAKKYKALDKTYKDYVTRIRSGLYNAVYEMDKMVLRQHNVHKTDLTPFLNELTELNNMMMAIHQEYNPAHKTFTDIELEKRAQHYQKDSKD